MSTDRNLLVGILAVQMSFVGRDELIRAMNAWVLEKHRPLADLLQLTAERRTLLDALVTEHIKAHSDDPQKSLAALSPSPEMQDSLAVVRDGELEVSIGHLAGATLAQTAPHRTQDASLRFRILRPHARGGLGEVFVAEDTELRREVALKEIQRRHADNANSRGRFVMEAEVTGGLEHPNIVPVYGLGTYSDGRPFYAMRFIRGDSLKEAVERYHRAPVADAPGTPMEFRNLLKRFVDVCNAVAYAHSRGVLHRDLKPANVMLGKFGETLVVDWGLARVASHSASRERERPEDAGEELLSSGGSHEATRAGSAVGTPPFMSPEQAAGRLDELGPPSDVYSLGATLYVILTGQPAFPADDVGETLRRIETGEFPPPRQVKPDVPAPLDAIVRKAMALRAQDRYSTATALAEEIEHYLADEPVAAYAEPFAARAKRWARKHPGTVAGAAAALLVGIVGLVAGSILLGGKNRELAGANIELDRAIGDLKIARDDADEKRKQAETARDQARKRFDLALDAFNDMVMGIQNKLEKRPGTQVLRKELLENARKGLKVLLQEAEREGNPDSTLVWSYFRMGDVEQLFGDTAAAQREYQAGHDLAKKLVDADPSNGQAWRDLGVSYNRLAETAMWLGQTRAALDFTTKYTENCQQLADAEPDDPELQRNLSIARNNLGNVLLRMGRSKDALEHYEKALAARQVLAKRFPDHAGAQRDLGHSNNNVGDALLRLERIPAALESYRRGLEISQRLSDDDPSNSQVRRDLGVSHLKVGDALLRGDRPKEALASFQKFQTICQRLADDDPKSAELKRDLTISHERVGDVLLELDDPKGALGQYEKGQAVCRKLAEADPGNAVLQRDLSLSLARVGDSALALGATAKAREAYEAGHAIDERLAKADPANAQTRLDLLISHYKLGAFHEKTQNLPAAIERYRKALAVAATIEPPESVAGKVEDLKRRIQACEKGQRETVPMPRRAP